MSLNIFDKLKDQHGSDVVWKKNGVYFFAIGDNLDDEDDEFAESQLHGENFDCGFDYGDGYDLMNCVEVKDLDKLTKEQVDFLEKFVGSNCYTREK